MFKALSIAAIVLLVLMAALIVWMRRTDDANKPRIEIAGGELRHIRQVQTQTAALSSVKAIYVHLHGSAGSPTWRETWWFYSTEGAPIYFDRTDEGAEAAIAALDKALPTFSLETAKQSIAQEAAKGLNEKAVPEVKVWERKLS
jgi:hypothetical protein